MGLGTARGGHLACTEEFRWVRIPQGPQLIIIRGFKMTEDQEKQIIDVCIDTYVRAHLDLETITGGNASEACHIVDEIFTILGIKRKKLNKQIEARIEELKRELEEI